MADDQQYQDENRSAAKTLWLGDVQPDWTEEYVESLFSSIVGQELEVKLIRDRHRGIVAGYGFIDFRNHETAQLVLDSLNGKPIEGTSLRYRLNWGAGGKRIEQAPEYSVFVGDLSPEVTDAELKATFLGKYTSVLGAKVVTNPMTGSSKSFGFIRFGDEQERDEALTAMNGAECCGRPIRVAPATKRTSVQGQTGAHATDPSNTTVFVGGINDSVTEKVLRDTFNSAGEIQTVTTPPGRGCAFVTFAHRASAEHVINNMQGTTVCGSCVRLSWGKSGRADRDRERERAGGDPIMGMGGIQSSPTAAAAAAAAAAARGAPFSGLYGHPQSYASFNGAYPDPSALANDLSQLSLSGGAASAVGSTSGGTSVGGGGRAARVGGSRNGGGGGGGGGMYGPASRSGGQGQGPGPGQGGQGPSFSLQDVRKGGLGPASRT
ncbi:conserved unknown protein [Ectocarpus siliculosus]|uniref:RRM domain-containing protein n=1 Tax=Ectocarpus siliculosus TaxID=2880 RepID=D7FKJ7_ECTSI|nr:conserved unknown protein [Ectocarpus siliculosus]|eukprot:CBJ29399.1 conserved unknown protein [Ectocarpus siliculosus]